MSGIKPICQCRRHKRRGLDPPRAWQPSPVFLPGKFHGERSLVHHLVNCSLCCLGVTGNTLIPLVEGLNNFFEIPQV